MARKPKISLEQKIEKTENTIATLETQLKASKAELKKLKAKKEQENINLIMDAIKSGNKSVDEVVNYINS